MTHHYRPHQTKNPLPPALTFAVFTLVAEVYSNVTEVLNEHNKDVAPLKDLYFIDPDFVPLLTTTILPCRVRVPTEKVAAFTVV